MRTPSKSVPQANALTSTFQAFFSSEKSGGILLMLCTAISLLLANSVLGPGYLAFWQAPLVGMSVEHWINDAGMAIFFLLIGLELERELYSGELASIRNALLPVIAAVGGVLVPALIHFTLNAGTLTQPGLGIPMATDIAFAIAALAILGSRVPPSLKVFVVAFAVMDDLLAIIVIAVFYTAKIQVGYLAGALAIFVALCALNRFGRVMVLTPYLLGGVVMWYLMYQSGIHATIAGVLLAFAIPFSARDADQHSPSHRLEMMLHKPVAFLILPLFALANTAIVVSTGWQQALISPNSLGILAGLVLGKPLGITVFCFVAVALGLCRLPDTLNWYHVWGAGLLGGIGFTMSIFIANLAFAGQADLVNTSKMAILLGSLTAGLAGLGWLGLWGRARR
jgi:Na+:H+ antiporter, NhaA family